VLESAVLHSQEVEQAISAAGAVKLYADWTDYPAEITDTIKALKSSGVPVIAIFPGDRPYEPIVFRGGYSKPGLIDALHRAAPKGVATRGNATPEVTAAMQ
jgi:thiol:disulfide interchange protein